MEKLRTVVLISGRGSNLRNLIKNCGKKNFPAKICLVISNNFNAKGLSYGKRSKIPMKIISQKNHKTQKNFERELNSELVKHKIEFVCLAGFMKILSNNFINKWSGKIINIHPSLLPSFKGLNAQKRAIQKGVKITGCTVHFVNSEMDNGPIIIQASVPVFTNDNEKILSKRILNEEHKIYPEALRLVAQKEIKIVRGKVFLKRGGNQKTVMINPLVKK